MAALILFCLLLFAGTIALTIIVASQATRLRRLERQMGHLDARENQLETRLREALGHPAGVASKPRPAEPPAAAEPALPRPVFTEQAPVQEPSPAPSRSPSRTRAEWEALIGGKLLNRIGALALILGVGFFLKYAFDNAWFTEWMRVAIGILIGATSLFTASRASRKGFPVFAQGLVGAGLAILYLSVYASFNFYGLISQPVAFAAMSVVTILAYVFAFPYDALSVSLLGLLGGFLTPFLLSTGEANPVGLFTYVALLDLGLLLVVMRKDSWMILEPLALAGTYLIYFFWHASAYRDEDLTTAVFFLAVFWVFFQGMDLLRLRRETFTYPGTRRWTRIVHSMVVLTSLALLFGPRTNEELAWMSIIAGAVYVGSGLLARGKADERGFARGQFLGTGILLLLASVIIRYEGFTEILVWSTASLVVVWMGLFGRERSAWTTGLLLLPLSIPLFLTAHGGIAFEPLSDFRPILNMRLLTIAVMAVCFGLAGFFYRRMAPNASIRLRELLRLTWFSLCILAVCLETSDVFRFWMVGAHESAVEHLDFQRLMALAGVAGLAGLLFLGFGHGARMPALCYGAFWVLIGAAALAGIRGLWYTPVEAYVPVLNIRVAVFLLLAFGFVGVTRVLGASPEIFDWDGDFRNAASYVPVILLVILVSVESWDVFRQETPTAMQSVSDEASETLERLHNLQHLTLSGVWLVFSVVLMLFGLFRRDRGRRYFAIGLFGIAIVKVFIYDLSFLDTLYRIFSFVGLGLILLGVSFLYQRYRDVIIGNQPISPGG